MLVLLHDIDDRKLAAAGAHRVDDFLETLPLSPSYRQRISEGVRQISYHAYTQKPQRVDLEVAIARDADWLDAIGAIGVARAFLYSGARGHAIYGGPDESATTLHHFEEKLLGLSRCLVTEQGKRMAEERQADASSRRRCLFAEHSVHDLSETADVAGGTVRIGCAASAIAHRDRQA